MSARRRLMCVLAHPDDESMGTGGILAKYAAEGVETILVTATNGEHGWFGEPSEYPGPAALGEIRRRELAAACEALGVAHAIPLGYEDGKLDDQDAGELRDRIAVAVRRWRPQVVVTFDPFGVYGHPDHIAVSQATTAAVLAAARSDGGETDPHIVQKLYYFVSTPEELVAFEEVFGELAMHIDGGSRAATGWPSWAITTEIDTLAFRETISRAIGCHQTQLRKDRALARLSAGGKEQLWGKATLYRVLSLVNGGRSIERDLFDGIA